MMSEFLIPIQKEDLLKGDSNYYFVPTVIPFSECSVEIPEIKQKLHKNGPAIVVEYFDVLFSYLYEPENISLNDLQELYGGIIHQLLQHLFVETNDLCMMDSVRLERFEALNMLKMIFYIFSMFLKVYEEKVAFNNENYITAKKGKKVPRKIEKENSDWDWNVKKSEAFSFIHGIVKLQLPILFKDTSTDTSLMNLICSCCFKALENCELCQVKHKILKDSVARVLVILVKDYNMGCSFISKSIQMMRNNESGAYGIVTVMIMLHEEHSCVTEVPRILNELLNRLNGDSQNLGKACSVFINELVETDVGVFLSSIKFLTSFLSVDAYPVRIAVSYAITETIQTFDDRLPINLKEFLIWKIAAHIDDENAYVRSKVIQLFTKMFNSSRVHKDNYLRIVENIVMRLYDKSTFVVKSAINSLSAALMHNPYGAKLKKCEFDNQLLAENNKLNNMELQKPASPENTWKLMESEVLVAITSSMDMTDIVVDLPSENEHVKITYVVLIIAKLLKNGLYKEAFKLLKQAEIGFPDSEEISCSFPKSDQTQYYVATLRKIFLQAADLFPQAVVPDYHEYRTLVEKQNELIKYVKESISFVNLMNNASGIIHKLMLSINTTEALEAVHFFTVAYKFEIGENPNLAIKDMLFLVKSRKNEFKEAVANAYQCLYLNTSQSRCEKLCFVLERLINLIKELNVDQKSALEELLGHWIENKVLDETLVEALVGILIKFEKNGSNRDLWISLVVLEMLTRLKCEMVTPFVDSIKELLKSHHLTCQSVEKMCSIISRCYNEKINGTVIKWSENNEIITMLCNIIEDRFSILIEIGYDNMALAGINLIFQFCIKPERVVNKLLHRLYEKMVTNSIKGTNGFNTSFNKDIVKVNEVLLSRLITLSGTVVFKKWKHLDCEVYNFLKRRLEESSGSEPVENTNCDELDEYCKASAGNELIEAIASTVLVKPGTLMYHLRQVIVDICSEKRRPCTFALMKSCFLSLSKLMMVSESFCEDQFQLFMTLIDRSNDPFLKTNGILAFGDLLCKYPNVVEPWTPYIVSRLEDIVHEVKLSTVTVLCHLISQEMIKVRGLFPELVLLLEDSNISVQEKVNNMLSDLSHKGNTIYGILPDVISSYTNPERKNPVSSTKFKNIISKLMGLVKKERNYSSFIEKLCLRLKESFAEEQATNISYCLTLVPMSEKCLQALLEALPSLSEKLFYIEVYTNVHSVISNCSKSSRSNLKELAAEGEKKLEELVDGKQYTSESSTTEESSTDNDVFIKQSKIRLRSKRLISQDYF